MSKNFKLFIIFFVAALSLLTTAYGLRAISVFRANSQTPPRGSIVVPLTAGPQPTNSSLQMQTFPFATITPTPTPTTVNPDPIDGNLGGGVSGSCGSVVGWAQQIAASLVIGGGGPLSGDGYDNRTQSFTSPCASASPRSSWAGQYWCTYLVVDAYQLAGIQGLSVGADGGVAEMHRHFGFISGYFTLDGTPNQATLSKVKPGYAIFFRDDSHVGLVKSIVVDGNGNGTLESYESNSSATSHKWPIAGWQVKNVSINGFGGHI